MGTGSAIDGLIARIRADRLSAELSEGQLARKAGLDWKALRGMDGEGWNPTANTLRALELVIPAAVEPRRQRRAG